MIEMTRLIEYQQAFAATEGEITKGNHGQYCTVATRRSRSSAPDEGCENGLPAYLPHLPAAIAALEATAIVPI